MKTLTAILALSWAIPASAQLLYVEGGRQPEDDAPDLVRMTVDPAPEPRPALKYSLVPKYADLQPGNAAPYYYRSLLAYSEFRGRLQSLPKEQRDPLDADFRVDDWTLADRAMFPRNLARTLVGSHGRVLEELRIAAHREDCDWDLRFRDLEGMQAIAFILEEFQNSRSLARLLVLKVRLEIAEGRHEDAIETFQLGFKLGRDVGRVPILINDLIGLAITSIMRHEMAELIATPGCPNLYWALVGLGEPVVDMKTSMKQEALLGENIFTFLKDADTAVRSDEEWDRMIREAAASMEELEGVTSFRGQPRAAWIGELGMAARIAKGYPLAIERLVEAGYDRAEVEEMPVGRVIAIDAQQTYRYVRDEIFKWSLLPAGPDRWQRARATEKELAKSGYLRPDGHEVLPIAATLLPAVSAASTAEVRIQRDLRALRVIEALRLYAAEHGQFPEKLDDIDQVPVPEDPWIGAPFTYGLENGVAILELVPPVGQPKRGFGRRYEITLRK